MYLQTVVMSSFEPYVICCLQMGEVNSSGVTGQKARFTISLPTHSLSFSSKVCACIVLYYITDVCLPTVPKKIRESVFKYTSVVLNVDPKIFKLYLLKPQIMFNPVYW